MTPQSQRDEWRRLEDAAKPGHWTADQDGREPFVAWVYDKDSGTVIADVRSPADAAFIAAARTAIPALLDDVERLERTLRTVLAYFDEACEYIAENPAEDDRLTAYLRRIDEARAALAASDEAAK